MMDQNRKELTQHTGTKGLWHRNQLPCNCKYKMFPCSCRCRRLTRLHRLYPVYKTNINHVKIVVGEWLLTFDDRKIWSSHTGHKMHADSLENFLLPQSHLKFLQANEVSLVCLKFKLQWLRVQGKTY